MFFWSFEHLQYYICRSADQGLSKLTLQVILQYKSSVPKLQAFAHISIVIPWFQFVRHNEKYHLKVLLDNFHLNSCTIRFRPLEFRTTFSSLAV